MGICMSKTLIEIIGTIRGMRHAASIFQKFLKGIVKVTGRRKGRVITCPTSAVFQGTNHEKTLPFHPVQPVERDATNG